MNSGTPESSKRQAASFFSGASGVNIQGQPVFNNIVGNQTNNNGSVHGIDRLEKFVSFEALHDSSAQDPKRQCHPGTRENVLNQILEWLDISSPTERILWLHGPAGVGKSAIAQTIAQSRRVGGTFFFFRSDPARNDGNRLFPTLAWQLANSLPDSRPYISLAMDRGLDLPRKAVEIQFEGLIAQPFKAAAFPISSPAIIIDGVDECLDEKLQRRLLEVIGNAVADDEFPLRFLICSRPEAHIQETIDQYPCKTLRVDLAGVDKNYKDVEKYLNDEFSRIAFAQNLDPKSWPGYEVVQDFVSRSSGQFVYASTIIKFIGDEDNRATTQLNIVLGLKQSDSMSLFADLDALYMEVLQRLPDQVFLKDTLSLLVITGKYRDDRKDIPLLLGVGEEELRRKLRKMRSVLKFDPEIAFHHRSLLDFLQDESRSRQYHIGEYHGTKRYLELIVDALVQYASKAIVQPEHHKPAHFVPSFSQLMRECPRRIDLPLQDWERVLQPLVDLREDWLKSGIHSSHWAPPGCRNCDVYHTIWDMLLHLAVLKGAYSTKSSDRPRLPVFARSYTWMIGVHKLALSYVPIERCFSLLLEELRHTNTVLSTNSAAIYLTRVLDLDPVETALKLRSTLDAQLLMDSIFNSIKKKDLLRWRNSRMVFRATKLLIAIHARVAILPQSIFLRLTEESNISDSMRGSIKHVCQRAFIWGILSHDNILSLTGIYEDCRGVTGTYSLSDLNKLRSWQEQKRPSISQVHVMMLDVARALRYMHSLGVVLDYDLSKYGVFIESNSHAKIQGSGVLSEYLNQIPLKFIAQDPPFFLVKGCSFEKDVREFGLLFHKAYEKCIKSHPIRPFEQTIHEKISGLIQRCLEEDPEARPSMDDVFDEMDILQLALAAGQSENLWPQRTGQSQWLLAFSSGMILIAVAVALLFQWENP